MPDYKKMIRKELFRIRGTVSDEQFFTSEEFLEFLQSAVDAATEGTERHITLHMLDPDSKDAAYTDGMCVHINTLSPIVMSFDTRKERYLAILGQLVHEIGHVLFTDFIVQRQHMSSLMMGRWFPFTPCAPEADEILEKITESEALKATFLSVAAAIRNIEEDVFIERRLERHFSGLFIRGLRLTAGRVWDLAPTIEKQSEDSAAISDMLVCQLLIYSRFGKMKRSSEGPLCDTALRIGETINSMKEEIEKLKDEEDAVTRSSLINRMLVKCLPLISEQSKHEDAIEYAKKIECEMGGLMPTGTTTPVKSPCVSDLSDIGIEKAEDSYARSRAEGEAETIHIKELRKEAAGILEGCHEEIRASLERDPDAPPSDIRRYSLGKAVPSSAIRIHRPVSVSPDLKEEYRMIYDAVRPICLRSARILDAGLTDRTAEGRVRGLPFGKRLDIPSISREDSGPFRKELLPLGKPDLAICLLVDESGSMEAYDRADAARRTAIILEDAMRRTLKEDSYAIIGHTADSGGDRKSLELFPYLDFDKVSDADRYRLADIDARDQNRDGEAVRYCCEKLLLRPEKHKVLIAITDGQPLAIDYFGEQANKELRHTIDVYRRKGILVFAAAIGSPNENEAITAIYGAKWTLLFNDLRKLPSGLSKLTRKLILGS